MIWFDGKEWQVNKYKIEETIISYADDTEGYSDKATITEVALSEEQQARLTEIQGIEFDTYDATLYVRDGIGGIPDTRSPIDIAIDKILELDPEQADNPKIIDIAEEWINYTDYPRFKMLKFDGNLYKTIHPIRSFEEGTPPERPDLYERIGQKDEATGLDELTPSTTNLYKKGAIGTWKGRVYESLYDGNGNEPDSVWGKDWWKDLGTLEEYLVSIGG